MRLAKISRTAEWILLGIIIIAAFYLSWSVSLQESAVMDELAHIPAGYGYVRYFDYRLNPEHPPLIKSIAALPLLFMNLNYPTQSDAWQKDINSQWEMGTEFLYQSGNNADAIIQWARIGPLIITLLLILLIYIWSLELLGRWWALLPTFLFALSPNILAHSHYVTTDIGAAFGIFLATYFLIKYLLHPSKKHLIYSALVFGIAELCKFSAVLLLPFFIFIVIVFYLWKSRDERGNVPFISSLVSFFKALWRTIYTLIIVFAIGFLLVYVLYFIFTINYPIQKQVADTTFTLTSFANGPQVGACAHLKTRCLADIDIMLAHNPVLRPFAQYLLGILMVLQRSSGGNTAYFLGQVSASGWWYYFPVVFLLKEPLPSLVLIGLALLLALWSIFKTLKTKSSKLKAFTNYLGTNFAEFSMISFVIFYWLYSVKSPLNIGLRHIFPTIPFIYILTAGALKKWTMKRSTVNMDNFWKFLKKALGNFLKSSLKGTLIIALLVWYLIETLIAYPNFLSYFNEFAGGKENGYKYVTDSNYDWGQDLKRLANFVEQNHIQKIAVDYFGGGDPKYYLNGKAEYWSSSKGNPINQGIQWLAVSINTIQGAKGTLAPGQQRNLEDEYSWLPNPYQPYTKAGTSIFIYKL